MKTAVDLSLEELIQNEDTPSLILTQKGYLRQISPAAAKLLGIGESWGETAIDKQVICTPPSAILQRQA